MIKIKISYLEDNEADPVVQSLKKAIDVTRIKEPKEEAKYKRIYIEGNTKSTT